MLILSLYEMACCQFLQLTRFLGGVFVSITDQFESCCALYLQDRVVDDEWEMQIVSFETHFSRIWSCVGGCNRELHLQIPVEQNKSLISGTCYSVKIIHGLPPSR
jgi:hypothetical protein